MNEDDALGLADHSREAYEHITDNPFIDPSQGTEQALSTFAMEVDTASYANVRRFINNGTFPPKDAVRIEEMVNYFSYDYAPPSPGDDTPFNVDLAVASAPWQPDHRLVRIGLKGMEVDIDQRPATNLVFLVDVSGSMNHPNKLPLVQQSLKMLVDQLHGDDKLAIVVYSGSSGVALPSTYVEDKQAIHETIDKLRAGGSTAGGEGIQLAYKVAQENFIEGGLNRVMLCTDGDFNVGVSSDGELVRLIEEKRDSGVFLSVLGFGAGNWQDAKMEKISNAGNGNFSYIDTIKEARKVLVEQATGTLLTIAKDVKVQVEFNPQQVQAYRLIGYENRVLAARDFNDDTKDAGEIGAGHTVTALYEIVPHGVESDVVTGDIDDLKYQKPADTASDAEGEGHDDDGAAGESAVSDELLTVKLRYKLPDEDTSTKIEFPLEDSGMSIDDAAADMKFVSAVAAFGMILRDSPYKGDANFQQVLELAEAGLDNDEHGHRQEFIDLVLKAAQLTDQ